MSGFDNALMAFSASLVHVLIVKNINLRSIQRSKKICLSLFIFLFALILTTKTVVQIPYIRLPIMFFLPPLCIYYIYKISMAESFGLSSLCDLIFLLGIFCTQVLTSNIFIKNIIEVRFTQTIIINLFFLILASLFVLLSNRLKPMTTFMKWGFKHTFFYVIIVFLIALFCFLLFEFTQNQNINYLSGVAFLNFIFKMCILSIFVYSQLCNMKILVEQKNKEYKKLIEYTTTIEDMYETLMEQRHDYSNIIFPMKGYIDEKNIDELKKYYEKHVLKEYCEKHENHFISSLKYIQNPGVKGIVSSKLNQATTKGIKVFVNVFTQIEINEISPIDLYRIMGIFLDNAIESSEQSQLKELHFGMEADKSHTSIVIANTYLQKPNIYTIFKRGYSSKGNGRGLGLYNLKRILSAYPHIQLKTSLDSNMFFQELIIHKCSLQEK